MKDYASGKGMYSDGVMGVYDGRKYHSAPFACVHVVT